MGRIGDSIVGIGRESSAYGTAGTIAARYEVVSENLKLDIDRIDSKALGKRYLSTWAPGKRTVEGDIEMEIPSAGFGRWLRAATGGAPTTSTSSPVAGLNTHVFSGETNISSSTEALTVEIQRTDRSSTDHKFVYTGCMISEFEISAAAGELAMAKFKIAGQDMSASAASASSASYATSTPLVFTGATVTVGGTSRSVKEMSFTTKQSLAEDRYFLGTDKRSQPIEAGMREASGTLKLEWDGLTDWNRYIGTSSVAIVATFETQAALAGSTKGSLEISIPYARIDGEQPVTTDGIIETDVTFTVLDEGASDPFKLTLIDATSSY